MGCRIIEGDDGAVLYCSTSMWAFGPVFTDAEHAEDFLKWLSYDPRMVLQPELEAQHAEWFRTRCDEHGDLLAYRLEYYPPDGCSNTDPRGLDGQQFADHQDAIDTIVAACGDHGHWTNDERDEGWHESDKEGCGGYLIVPL